MEVSRIPFIGYIASDPAADQMEHLLPDLEPFCRVRILRVNRENPVDKVCKRLPTDLDCFAFSGRLLYLSALEVVSSPPKPFYALDELEGDINSILLRTLLEHRDFDLSRIFIDFATKENNYLGLKELLPPNQWPKFNDFRFENAKSAEQQILEMHLSYYKKGLTDLSITRMGLCLEALKAAGVPCVYAYPPKDYVINFFLQIVNTLERAKLDHTIFGAIVFEIAAETPEDVHSGIAECQRFLTEIVRSEGRDFMIQEVGNRIEILTRQSDLEEITHGFEDDSFKSIVERAIGYPVRVGLGSGTTMYQARMNAFKASSIGLMRNNGLYYYSAEEVLIGPLGGNNKPEHLDLQTNKKLLNLADTFQVDYVTLKRIIACTKALQRNEITAEELADFSNITPRSAARLLNKIVANGGGRVYLRKVKEGKGRPKKRFILNFVNKVQ